MKRLLSLVFAIASIPVFGQVQRTEKIPIGKVDQFFEGEISLVAERTQGGGNTLALRVSSRLDMSDSLTRLSEKDVSIIITNLVDMYRQSAETKDELSYAREENNFIAKIMLGGEEPEFSVLANHAMVTTYRTGNDHREVLREVIDLLKQGQAAIASSN